MLMAGNAINKSTLNLGLRGFFEGYWLIERFGYDTRKPQFSSLIVSGQMTRNDALRELRTKPLSDDMIREEFEYIADKLGISVRELQSYLAAPHKDYRDYSNMDWVYNVGSSVMTKARVRAICKKMIGIIDYNLEVIYMLSKMYFVFSMFLTFALIDLSFWRIVIR